MDQEVLKYVDRGFSYALVVYLLWERRDLLNAVKTTLDELKSVIGNLATIIKERLLKD
jgi:hypothetical protein